MYVMFREIKRIFEGIKIVQRVFEEFVINSDFLLLREVVYIGCGSFYFLLQLLVMVIICFGGRGVVFFCFEFFYLREYYFVGKFEFLVLILCLGEMIEVVKVFEFLDVLKFVLIVYESMLLRKVDYVFIVFIYEESVVMIYFFMVFYFVFFQFFNVFFGLEIYDVEMILELMREVLKNEGYIWEIIGEFDFRNVIFFGLGIFYLIVFEVMFKMKEMVFFWSEVYQIFEVRYGFKLVVDEGILVVFLVNEFFDWYEKFMKEFQGQGVRVLMIGNGDIGVDYFIDFFKVDELFILIFYFLIIQFFLYYKVIKRGLNFDQFCFFSKVVKW